MSGTPRASDHGEYPMVPNPEIPSYGDYASPREVEPIKAATDGEYHVLGNRIERRIERQERALLRWYVAILGLVFVIGVLL